MSDFQRVARSPIPDHTKVELARARAGMGKKPEECRMQTLAKSAAAHVQRCVHCNCVAIHVGPVTLRFDPGAAESLWNTLGEGLTRLERELTAEPTAGMVYGKPHGSA